MLDQFLDENPEVSINLTLSDGYVDLVGLGVDLALRYGELSDSTMKSRKIGSNRRLVCASPEYLRKNGTPKHPDDLADHNCLLMRFGSNTDQDWSFLVDGKVHVCRVNGNRIANDGDLIRRWCCKGFGVALKSEWDVQRDLENGTLVEVLGDFAPKPTTLQLVIPAGPVQPRRVRALMEFLALSFALNKDETGHSNEFG